METGGAAAEWDSDAEEDEDESDDDEAAAARRVVSLRIAGANDFGEMSRRALCCELWRDICLRVVRILGEQFADRGRATEFWGKSPSRALRVAPESTPFSK